MKSDYSFGEMGFGAWEAVLQAYFAMPGTEAEEREQAFKSLAQCQLELWGLTSRRLQACLSMPAALSQSKTPLDFMRAQAKFCETAFLQGAESTRRMNDAVCAATGATNGTATAAAPEFARDLITLPVSRKSPRPYYDQQRGAWRAGDQRRVA